MRPKGEAIIAKTARLMALLALADAGKLEGASYQAIADLLGDGLNRSTILRDLRVLPDVRKERDRLMKRLKNF